MVIERTLRDLGNGNFAYTQLPGSWGWSNAGLVTDGDQSLLVDTLFDRPLTAKMLAAMRDAAPAAKNIGTVVNTHGNGDHCYGNGAVEGAEIIGSQGCVDDLLAAPPSRNAMLVRAAPVMGALGPVGRALGRLTSAVGIHTVAWLTEAAPMAQLFREFEFAGNEMVLPTRIFSGSLTLRVGDKKVELMEVGPAHTLGDVAVYVPDDQVLFTGDILFKDAHPIVWQGPVTNWIKACETLLALDVMTVVPGHGPVTDLTGLRETKAYLELLMTEARARYDAGMSVDEAVRDIALDAYAGWIDPERVFVNVHMLYREFEGETGLPELLELMAGMGRLKTERAV